jgi:hypothetical protein
MILFILTDVADNDSKFTVVGYEEDWCDASARFWSISEKYIHTAHVYRKLVLTKDITHESIRRFLW